MKRFAFLFILTTLLLGSCAPATASPTQPVAATVTQTALPFPTLTPTLTAIPSATPYPPLHTQGPYLLYTRDHKSLTILDADGSGRKQIQLPDNGYAGYPLDKSVSPDGKWITFFTGTKEEPYNLSLNIFNLKDETTLFISSLIAPGFPENLEPVTKTAFFTEYDTDCSNDPKCRLQIIKSAFLWGIESLAWSPDGKALAFAAQIDGPSSDVYIYDMDSKSIRRVTNELEDISSINWSPNGKKILYTTSQPGTIYISDNIRIADPQSKSIQNPKAIDGGLFWGSKGWIAEDSYMIWDGGEGAPPHNFRFINTETNQVKTLWGYISESSSLFPDREGIVIVLYQEQIDTDKIPFSAGTYFISINEKPTKISDKIYFPIETQGSLTNSFLAINGDDKKLYAVNVDTLRVNLLTDNRNRRADPIISPDKKWIIVQTDTGVNLYSSDLQLVKTWNILALEPAWRSDSLGLFWQVYNQGLFYVPIPSGEPVWLSDCKPEYCPDFNNGVWLP